jgi:hypothetical protein
MTAQRRKRQGGDFMDIVASEKKKPVNPMFPGTWEGAMGAARKAPRRR